MNQPLYIGSNGHVCAIDTASGVELWRTKLQRGMLKATNYEDVSIIVKDSIIYAGCQGHLFALAADGRVLWHNPLKGLGHNDLALAFEGHSIQYIQKHTHSHSSTNQG